MRGNRAGTYPIVVGGLIALVAIAGTLLAMRTGFAGSGERPVYAAAAAAAGPPNTITVVGEGRQQAAPDTAHVDLGVAATRGNIRDALATSSDEMRRLLNAVRNQGVADPDIQTTGLSVQTNWNYGQVTGYTATNSVSITIHHLQNVSTIITAAVQAVGNDAQVNGISFELRDNAAQLQAARQAALAAAGAQANQWARLAGRKVGKLLSVSEVVLSGPSAPMCSGGCGGGGGIPIEAGRATVDLTVTAVYELND